MTTDEDGEVTQTLDYYPYGSQRIATGSFAEQRRFIGEEYDRDTEFSYLNARYYQGSRGQFMSQDPVFLLMGDPRRMKEMTQQELAAILADPQVLTATRMQEITRSCLRIAAANGIEVVDRKQPMVPRCSKRRIQPGRGVAVRDGSSAYYKEPVSD